MKGIILAGGKGTRLRPMTHVVNKHVLPVYDKPMIFYPVETLLRNDVNEIMVVSTPNDIGRYITLLENEYDADFTYRVQTEPGGIAHALSLAEDYTDDALAVMLGDNIVRDNLSEVFQEFEQNDARAQIFLKEVQDPARYGIAEFEDGEIADLVEKPEDPDSKQAVIGMYMYDNSVFDIIDRIEPSDRGELEITDVNQLYLKRGELNSVTLDGDWFDVGTPEGLFKATKAVREDQLQ